MFPSNRNKDTERGLPASRYGKQSDVYYGLDFTMNARFGASGTVLGGLSTGTQVTNNCNIVAKVPELGIQPTAASVAINAAPNRVCNPNAARQTQVKLSGSYELPDAIRASVNYQNIPGVNTAATFNLSPATITAALGRAPNNVGTRQNVVGFLSPRIIKFGVPWDL